MMPIGPMAALCIHRTLFAGRAAGFASGLGVAAGDIPYSIVAAFALPAVQGVASQRLIVLVGALLVVAVGVAGVFRPLPNATRLERTRSKRGLAAVFGSSALLTVSQPATVVVYAAIFAATRATGPEAGFAQRCALVAGCFVGSSAWFFVLVQAVANAKSRLTPTVLLRLGRALYVAIALFGLVAFGLAAFGRN